MENPNEYSEAEAQEGMQGLETAIHQLWDAGLSESEIQNEVDANLSSAQREHVGGGPKK